MLYKYSNGQNKGAVARNKINKGLVHSPFFIVILGEIYYN